MSFDQNAIQSCFHYAAQHRLNADSRSLSWKDKATGQPQERTEWHNVVLFNKIAEIAKECLRKGSQIYVEGKLRTRQWRTSDGQERSTTEVVVDLGGTMQMLDSRLASSEPVNAHRPRSNRVAADDTWKDNGIPF